jgi:ribosome maturation factor RimP
MIDEGALLKLTEEYLSQSGLFVAELTVKPGNNIMVSIDGDKEVSIDDCVALARFIESSLNRDEEDYNLQVSSAGVDQPLKTLRQYTKNIGRRLGIDLADGGNITGKLVSADSEKIQVQKEIKKGRKITSGDIVELDYAGITKAVCLVSFK